MCLKFIPNGFTQKRSRCSGSRTVMWPATPSSKPNLPNSRNDAASRCLRCSRSSSTESNFGRKARSGSNAVMAEILGPAGASGSLRAQRLGGPDPGRRPGRPRPRAGWRASDRGRDHEQHGDERERRDVDDREVVGEPAPHQPARRRCRAGRRRSRRPAAISVACHAIATRVWRRVKPSERSTASSWRRRRTVVTSACATVADASSAKNTPSASGSERELAEAHDRGRERGRADVEARAVAARRARASRCSRGGRRRRPAPTSRARSPRSRSGRACRRGPIAASQPGGRHPRALVVVGVRRRGQRARCRRPSRCGPACSPTATRSPTCSFRSLQRAGAERDLVGARRRAPGEHDRRHVALQRRRSPTSGSSTPLMRTLRTHDRVQHARDVAVVRDRRDVLRRRPAPRPTPPRSSTRCPTAAGSRPRRRGRRGT